MPKRATHTFESEKDGIKDEKLGVQFCMCCGESVLILGPETQLADLPRRRTDGALVLERGNVVFKLNSKPRGTKVIKRAGGYERQYRFGCWNCGVLLGYRAEEGEDVALTYLLPDATGQQADLYLQMYQVPPCIQSTGELSVRVAVDVQVGQARRALLHVNDNSVGVNVTSSAREGLANAELLEYMSKVLSVVKGQLQLSRGWSAQSKYLLVSGLKAIDVFKRLSAGVEAVDAQIPTALPPGVATTVPHSAEGNANYTAGAAAGVARRHWEVCARNLHATTTRPFRPPGLASASASFSMQSLVRDPCPALPDLTLRVTRGRPTRPTRSRSWRRLHRSGSRRSSNDRARAKVRDTRALAGMRASRAVLGF